MTCIEVWVWVIGSAVEKDTWDEIASKVDAVMVCGGEENSWDDSGAKL